MAEKEQVSQTEGTETATEAARIAAALDEPEVGLVCKVVHALGTECASQLLAKTLEIEAQGGLLTADEQQRRTPGGVFFRLVRDCATKEEGRLIFRKKKKPPEVDPVSGEAIDPSRSGGPAPLTALSWDEAKVEVARILEAPMERASVKITLIGRPTQVSRTRSCVVVAMKGSRPPSLPKGLPKAPEDSDFSYAVFIANKHWAKVAPDMAEDNESRLIVEGYPLFDPKRGVTVVLAQQVRTLTAQRRTRSRR